MRRALALIAVCTLGWTAVATAQSAELEVKLRLAVRKLEQGDALGALLDLESVLARDESNWEAYFQRGRAQAQMGDDLGARVSFQRASDLDPGNAELHFLMATMSWQLADFDTAWSQSIAAVQAGYDREAAQQLMKGLEAYSPKPPDLERRMDARRVVVVATAPEDDEMHAARLDDLALELRSGLFRFPLVALTKVESIARYRVDLSVAEDGAGFDVVLRDVLGGGEELYRGMIEGAGDIEIAETQLQVMDRVDEIEAALAGARGESGS